MSTEVFIPEFIPFYIAEVEKFKLSTTEGLVYGFCRFYKKNNKHFYFTSDQLSKIIGCSVGTVDNCFSELAKKGLLETKKVGKGGGGTVRFVNRVLTLDSDDLIKGGGDDLTKGGDSIKENNILEYNNINNINIINDSEFSNSTSLEGKEKFTEVNPDFNIEDAITRLKEVSNPSPTPPQRKRGDTGVNDVIKIVQDKCKELGIVYQKGKNERARAKNFTQKTKTEQIQEAGFNCFSDYVDFVFDKQAKFKIGKTINSVEMLYYKGNDVINQYNLNFKNLDNLKFEIHDWAKLIADSPDGSKLSHNVCKYSTRLGRGLLEGRTITDVENALEEIKVDYFVTSFDLVVSMEEHYNYYINKSYKEGNYIASLRKRIFNNLKRSAGN